MARKLQPLRAPEKSAPLHKIDFYIRVNTEEQAENPEGSIKNQEERLKSTVQFKNMEGPFGRSGRNIC